MKQPAQRWLVVLVGLAVGLLLGLGYAWLVDPVRPVNAYPSLLRADYRQDWLYVATLSFLEDGDLARLRSRLAGMDDADIQAGLTNAVEVITAEGIGGQATERATALVEAFKLPLHDALAPPAAVASSEGTDAEHAPPAMTFRVAERSFACGLQPTARVEVVVRGSSGNGMPGLRLWLVWDGGADWAVTGLIPGRGSGYADFDVASDARYSLGVGEYGMPLLSGLTIPECSESADGEARLGAWRIVVTPSRTEGREGEPRL